MWRDAQPADDEAVIVLFLALNEADPGPEPVAGEQVRHTLMELRRNPSRGKAVVLDIAGVVLGYALLISFWSNELGGEVCVVDEIFVAPGARGLGHGGALLEGIGEVWRRPMVAASLEISPTNQRASELYRRLGFQGVNIAMIRRHVTPD